jgi:nucleotide-binding universal stress UspA family protein
METSTSSRIRSVDTARSQTRPRSQGIRRILACLDRSSFSDVCVSYAASLSKTFGSTVTLLHVMQRPHEPAGLRTTNALGWEISRHEATTYLEQKQKEAARASGQDVVTRLEQGHPAERITALARELDADLTVLGSQGEGGLTAWNLGSTVHQVLAVARGSVLVARSSSPGPAVLAPKRILVPLDGSLRTESVLPTAVRIAKAHDAEVLLVHVVSEPLPTAILRTAEDLELARELTSRVELRAREYLATLRDQLAREITNVRTLVVRDADERQRLLEIAQKEKVDLVVVSAHGSTCNPARPFGSVAAHLLTHSTVSLLVLQDLSNLERASEVVEEAIAPPLRGSYPPEEA